MQSYRYLYENIMFTNKTDAALFWESVLGAKGGGERVALIKSLI